MTGRRRTPRGPGDRPPRQPPKPQSRPKGFDDVPELSAEEVERRVDVRGGGAPRGPVERPTRTARPPRRQERTLARDSLLLIGLVIVGLIAVRFILPEGPLSAVASESPGASQAAVVSLGPQTFGPTRTPFVETLTPVVTPSSEPVTNGPTAAPTAKPVPTPTVKPGQTPRPTPKVTPAPTAPNTATVIVKMHVINNSGGVAAAANWTMLIQGEAGSAASPKSFPGTEAGLTVTIPAGKGYKVTDNAGVPGYAGRLLSSDCLRADGSGGLTAGTTVTCTITRNDRPRVLVATHVINNDAGTAAANDWSVTVTSELATPSAFTGTEGGTTVVIGIDLTYTVQMSGPFDGDYTRTTDGDCGPQSLSVDAPETTCTFTYDDNTPPPAPGVVLPWFLPALGLLGSRRPRWWTAIRTR